LIAESWVTIATKPSRRALALPHSISTTLCCVPRRFITSDQISGNTGCWVACSPAPETCITHSKTLRQHHTSGVKRHHVQPRGLCGGRQWALPTGGGSSSLGASFSAAASYPLRLEKGDWKRKNNPCFIQLEHAPPSGGHAKNKVKWAFFYSGVFIFHRTICRMGL
jgi:hypothetical protein